MNKGLRPLDNVRNCKGVTLRPPRGDWDDQVALSILQGRGKLRPLRLIPIYLVFESNPPRLWRGMGYRASQVLQHLIYSVI